MIKVSRSWIWFGVSLIVLGILYALLCRPHIAGLYYDDGVYLQAARELALGHGYRLISEPASPAVVKYPPLFSLLLSGIWRLNPSFPGNLPVMKALNILLSLSGLVFLYALCKQRLGQTQHRWLLSAFVMFWGLNPSWVFTSIDILSEPLYLLLSLATLFMAMRLYQQRDKPLSTLNVLALVVLSVATFYTRTIGLSLIVALVIWLWRQYGAKWAVSYGASCLVLVSLWFFWCASHQVPIQKIGSFHCLSFNQTYWMEMVTAIFQSKGITSLLANNAFELSKAMLTTIFPFLNVSGLSPLLLFTAGSGLLLASWVGFYRLVQQNNISPILLYLAFYYLCCLAWPYPEQYPRFLIVILPLLAWQWICFFIDNGNSQNNTVKKYSAIGIPFLFLIISALNFNFTFGAYPFPTGDRLAVNSKAVTWQEYQQVFQDLRRLLKPTDVAWSPNSMLYPLYFQVRVINRNIMAPPVTYDGHSPQEKQEMVFAAVLGAFRKNHVTHVFLEPRVAVTMVQEVQEQRIKALIDRFPYFFTLEYESLSGMVRLYRFTG